MINKEGLDLEARLQPKMETPPKDIVGNVHALLAGRSAKAISTSPRVSRMPGCMLTILSCSSSTVGCAMSTNTPGMGHWLYTLPAAPLTKVANGPFKWGLQHRFGLASPCAGHLCGKQLPGARQPCKAPLDAIGRHVAWCARRHRNQTQSFGKPGLCAQRTLTISEPNGTDIWVDVRIGMAKPDCSVPKELARVEQEKLREYGQGPSNPSTLFDGVVPVIFEQHGCPSQCAITFLYYILRRRVAKLEQSSHLAHGVAWMIASKELYAPIACILLVMRHHMFQECSPIVQMEDQPRELPPTGASNVFSQPSSQGEPWPDAAPWQGQESQLSPPKGWMLTHEWEHEANGPGLE